MRTAWVLLVIAAGCSSHPVPAELADLLQALGSEEQAGLEQRFAGFLAKHANEIEPYLGYPGYHVSNGYAMSVGECRFLESEGRPYVVVELRLNSISIPGECASRLVLISEFGKVADVATVVWPSRLMDRLKAVLLEEPDSDHTLLWFWDDDPNEYWGNFSPPCFYLHEKDSRRVSLPWTGGNVLGHLAVEKGQFVAVRRKR